MAIEDAIRWSKRRDECPLTTGNQANWRRHEKAGRRTGGKRRSIMPERMDLWYGVGIGEGIWGNIG